MRMSGPEAHKKLWAETHRRVRHGLSRTEWERCSAIAARLGLCYEVVRRHLRILAVEGYAQRREYDGGGGFVWRGR
jgi:predicted ArsR family transcriptional regulator